MLKETFTPRKKKESVLFTLCEAANTTENSPRHIRLVRPGTTIHPQGGIPKGSKTLCGSSVKFGWDVRNVDSDQATAIMKTQVADPEGDKIGTLCSECADALISTGV